LVVSRHPCPCHARLGMGRQGEPEHGCLSGWGLHRPERGGVTFRAGNGRIPDVGRAGGHGSGKNLPAAGGSGEPGGSRCDRDSVAFPTCGLRAMPDHGSWRPKVGRRQQHARGASAMRHPVRPSASFQKLTDR
jgi:hypothetical protein